MKIEDGQIYELKGTGMRHRAVHAPYSREQYFEVMHLLPVGGDGPLLQVSSDPDHAQVIWELIFPQPGEEITEDSFVMQNTTYSADDLVHVPTPMADRPIPDEVIMGNFYNLDGTMYAAVEIEFHGLPTDWLVEPPIGPEDYRIPAFGEAFERLAAQIRMVLHPDGRIFSYHHPVMGDDTGNRAADLAQVG